MSVRHVPFNINEYVRVKLTDYGRQVHREEFEALMACYKLANPPKYTPPTEDADGWSKWQMHDLMRTFGDHMGIGCCNVFDTNIEFEVRDT